MHRKYVGISLAQNMGFWYYDMDKQFIDDEVLAEVGEGKKMADDLATRKGVDFKADVCLVRFDAEARHYGTAVDNAVAATNQWQYMLLETSGVPYEVHFIDDIKSVKELQDFKVFIFHNNSYISTEDRNWINTTLKSDNRFLIWMYDSGYIGDDGLDIDGMSDLIGMNIATETSYQRDIALMDGKDILTGANNGYVSVPKFQGMTEAL